MATGGLFLLIRTAGTVTTDSVRVYNILSQAAGWATIGAVLGLLPLKTSTLATQTDEVGGSALPGVADVLQPPADDASRNS